MTSLLATAVISSTVSTLGCSGNATDSPRATSNNDKTSSFSGEEIFRGVYFGQGPVAAYFPEIWHLGERTTRTAAKSASSPTLLADQIDAFVGRLCTTGCSPETLAGLRSAAVRLRAGEDDRTLVDPEMQLARISGPRTEAIIQILIEVMHQQQPAFFDNFAKTVRTGNPVEIRRSMEDAHRLVAAAAAAAANQGGANLTLVPALAHTQTTRAELDGPFILVVVVAVAVFIFLEEPQTQVATDELVAKIATRLRA